MSSFKGVLGETVINVAMWLKLEKDLYHRLNNITLPLANGGSTQIDHVIVSKYGIFVIETKNYKGWIFGNEKQRQWTQVIMGRKYKFQNPLRQNYLHIKTLADLLDLEMSHFHSMIAFIGECELKTRDELPEHVLTNGMVSYIKRKQDEILSEDEVQSIVAQIENNRFSKSWRTNQAHKAYLKDKHSQSDKPLSSHRNTKPVVKPVLKPAIREVAKSREVMRWSGQTEVESSDLPIDSLNPQQISSPHDIADKVFLTPFEVIETEPQVHYPATLVAMDNIAHFIQAPTCPRCNSEMVKRVTKKGARQGQEFYGCLQFPKCRGIVNTN
ncbi:NERD domain-containing protein [Psychrobacter arcticus]|nr:NERD domain-containing protein [Psychrobacter arcticus]